MPQKNEDEIELRSEEVQEILSYMPHWLIRWGITIFILVIFLLLLLSWFVKYPDIVTAPVVISTQTPPSTLIARTSGAIAKLYINENDKVKPKQKLGVIYNTAIDDDVYKLKNYLENLPLHYHPDSILNYPLDTNLVLGELQIYFSEYMQSIHEYENVYRAEYYLKKIDAVLEQIDYYKSLNQKLKNQIEFLNKELQIVKEKFDAAQKLYNEGSISKNEFGEYENMLLQKQQSFKSAEINEINNQITVQEYNKTVMDLSRDYEERKKRSLWALQEAYKKMISQILLWEQQYVLISPIEGKISFFKFWNENQYVNAGEEILTVVPDSNQLIGKVYVQGFGAGKVEAGQKVRIKFDSYPYNEFGAVHGRVKSVSPISRENVLLIDVELPNGLITNYNKKLEFRQQMGGAAEIVTEDLRLIERFFDQFKYLFKNSIEG
jgi:HlyD family secretion protein